MQGQVAYTYLAFISYSSKDRLVGERFQRALEGYKIPRLLRGRMTKSGAVPRRPVPIFRDRSDLVAGADLGGRIQDGLNTSRSLIVLCSPHSAQSNWVNEEIRTFKRQGREHRIIAVLVDGRPVSWHPQLAPDGAFPPALLLAFNQDGSATGELAPEPFAPDLREMDADGRGGDGFEFAKLKVVARLIDVPLAELTQRQREVERAEQRIVQAVAAGMFVLAAAATTGGFLAWRQTLEANARLDQTIDMAARQIETAAQYESRYGVSSAIVRDMLASAQKDFSGLLADGGGTPRLGLHAARLGLSFAEAFEDAGDREGRQDKSLAAAEEELVRLESRSRSLGERVGLSTAPAEEDVVRARLRLLAARARKASEAGENEKAIQALAGTARAGRALGGADWGLAHGAASWRWGNCAKPISTTRTGSQSARKWPISWGSGGWTSFKPEIIGRSIGRICCAVSRISPSRCRRAGSTSLRWSSRNGRRDCVRARRRSAAGYRAAAQPRDGADTARRRGAQHFSGDQAKAIVSYVEAEAAARALSASDPQRVDWRRAQYIVLERLGSARFQVGEIAAADVAFGSALDIVEALSRQAPEDARRQYDVGVMQERIGQFMMAQAEAAATPEERTRLLQKAAEALVRLTGIRVQAVKANPGGKIQLYHLAIAAPHARGSQCAGARPGAGGACRVRPRAGIAGRADEGEGPAAGVVAVTGRCSRQAGTVV